MLPRIPQQSAAASGPKRFGVDAGLSAELAPVVSGARRRALRDGDRQIDTAHLLHSLLESDPEVRAAFGGGPQLDRLLGYLVQRSIGYGLRWQSAAEDFGAGAVTADGRWSPVAADAMEEAHGRAVLRGDERARGLDLLVALVADPRSRAVEVLGRAGVELPRLLERAGSGHEECAGRSDTG
ncbi:Clp protease N-terminal domain-containing protein [Streptomyces triticiradicis]|uniref:Clp protease N-terminal domain-containing protein n=1 Tax=Streptomyces triticiradicis TaxID=2651189 RepID=UPI001CECB611|nr:Clp protease N-terminal domain-containing protein [Streptomyces triticiradicis]